MFFLRGSTSDNKEFVVMDADAAIASALLPEIAPVIGLFIVAMVYSFISGIDLEAVYALLTFCFLVFIMFSLSAKISKSLEKAQLLFMLPFFFFGSVLISLDKGAFYEYTKSRKYLGKEIFPVTFCELREKYDFEIPLHINDLPGIKQRCELLLTMLVIGCCVSFILFYLCRIMNWRAISIIVFIFAIVAVFIGIQFFLFPEPRWPWDESRTRLPVFLGLKCFVYAVLFLVGGIYTLVRKKSVYDDL